MALSPAEKQSRYRARQAEKQVEDADIDISAAKVPDVQNVKITASLGVSDFRSEETPEEFYHNTDKALYEAKGHGRNKVVVFERASV